MEATKLADKKSILAPELRFKGFHGEWEKDRLINLTSVLRCGIASTPTYVEKGIPFLSAQNVTKQGEFSLHKYNFISEEYYKELSKNHKLLKGDILYSRVGAGFGTAAIFPFSGEYGVYVSLTHIRANAKLINPFLKYYLNSEICKEQASNGVFQGGGVPNLNVKIVEKFKINFPTLPEQQKIASFLSAVDEKIQQLTRKKEMLEQYKKGVMQQLFSGKLRFKDENGKVFSKWENRKLGDVLFEHKLNSTGKEEVYSVSVHKGLINQIEHLGRVFAAKNTGNYNLVKPYDIIYTKSPTGSFPLGIIKQSKITKNVIVSPLYGVFTPETPGLGYMLNVYFESPLNVKNYLSSIIQKGAKNTINITNSTFLSKKLKLPVSKEEQQKIGDFLLSIDRKIENVSGLITQTQTFKKGLLQQMFV